MRPHDARTHVRIPFSQRVELWEQRSPLRVRARNLSLGGIFLETDHDFGKSAYWTLRVPLAQGPRCTVLCKVVRRQTGAETGAALRFVDLSLSDRTRLIAFVKHRARDGLRTFA